MGSYIPRTLSQNSEEMGQFRAAGGHFTQAGWETGGNDWTTPNPWVGLMDGAQQYPSVILADAIRACYQLHGVTSSTPQPLAGGCTENPQCTVFRRSGGCQHLNFRHPSINALTARPPPSPTRLPIAIEPTPVPIQGEMPHADQCPTRVRCPAFMRTGYCTHFSDEY